MTYIKALFIRTLTQPAPVPLRRRHVAIGVYERGKCAHQLCVGV